jgi:hypothetical protein
MIVKIWMFRMSDEPLRYVASGMVLPCVQGNAFPTLHAERLHCCKLQSSEPKH